ncbi:hypothetical protein LOCC1_G008421 [Lachnellula occidentalis]|uniref:C2H2-type domain-containing protein n=1 Tax=Lachnellula occidentalis TaxID=215460 RepID=A0A8H8U429_9HELO|nr:hypothetical protein LOCC1_G008421 [Lachnellula occidentalis]
MPSLIQHQKSTKHCPCPQCDPCDSYEALLESHLPPLDKYSCPECGRSFAQKPALEAHQRESMHASCYNCDVVSPTRALHALHMKSHSPVSAVSLSSATQFRCCDCQRDCKSERALADHLRSRKGVKNKQQKKKQNQQEEGSQKNGCKKCNVTFKNRGALTRHLTSVRHHPLSDIKCLADAKCKKQFNCPSGQLHHLESGKCVSGMTKTKLNAAIAAKDTGQIIASGGATAKSLLEENPSVSASSTSQIRSPILTPTSTEFLDTYPPSAILTPTSTLSTETNFHSMLTIRLRPRVGFQTCPLCPSSRTRKFQESALQQHLSSSFHAQVSMSLPLLVPDEISFHCPRTMMGEGSKNTPLKQFSTVSGLTQHLESGACDGGRGTFRRAVEYVQEEMKGMGLGRLKLLN